MRDLKLELETKFNSTLAAGEMHISLEMKLYLLYTLGIWLNEEAVCMYIHIDAGSWMGRVQYSI